MAFALFQTPGWSPQTAAVLVGTLRALEGDTVRVKGHFQDTYRPPLASCRAFLKNLAQVDGGRIKGPAVLLSQFADTGRVQLNPLKEAAAEMRRLLEFVVRPGVGVARLTGYETRNVGGKAIVMGVLVYETRNGSGKRELLPVGSPVWAKLRPLSSREEVVAAIKILREKKMTDTSLVRKRYHELLEERGSLAEVAEAVLMAFHFLDYLISYSDGILQRSFRDNVIRLFVTEAALVLGRPFAEVEAGVKEILRGRV